MQIDAEVSSSSVLWSSSSSRRLSLLRGRALAWAEAVNSHQSLEFLAKRRDVFNHPDFWGDASRRLINIRQGACSVANYSVEFKTLAADAGWDDAVLRGLFLNGLSDLLQHELATREETDNFKGLVSQAIQLDNRLRGRRQQGAARHSPFHLPRSEGIPHALQPLRVPQFRRRHPRFPWGWSLCRCSRPSIPAE